MITINATQLLYWIAGIVGAAFTVLFSTVVGLWVANYFKQNQMHRENQKLWAAAVEEMKQNPPHRHMDVEGYLEVVNIEPRKARAYGD